MIVQSFRSVLWVGAVAGAAISCYMVSLRVAAERAALERVETRILLAKRDIRALDTELTTRGRLRQLERWNSDVLALTAPTEGQFLEGEVQLASLGRAESRGSPTAAGDDPDGDTSGGGEPFMHAIAEPPPAPDPRPILADYKPARARARLVEASAVKAKVTKAGAIRNGAAERARGDTGRAKLSERVRAKSAGPTKRETAARADRKAVARKPFGKAASNRDAAPISGKKAKAKTTT